MIFKSIEDLIKLEQERQNGLFIETDNLDSYLMKIKNNADYVTHCKFNKCKGFVAFYCNDPTKEFAFITLVLLSPEFRGKGLASNLIRYTLQYCKDNGFRKCGLNVKKDNFSTFLYKFHVLFNAVILFDESVLLLLL